MALLNARAMVNYEAGTVRTRAGLECLGQKGEAGGIPGARPRPKVAGAATQLAHRRTRNAMFDWPRIASGRMLFFAGAAAAAAAFWSNAASRKAAIHEPIRRRCRTAPAFGRKNRPKPAPRAFFFRRGSAHAPNARGFWGRREAGAAPGPRGKPRFRGAGAAIGPVWRQHCTGTAGFGRPAGRLARTHARADKRAGCRGRPRRRARGAQDKGGAGREI